MNSETNVRLLRVVVASPSDVQSERNAVPQIVDELNGGIARERMLRIEVSRWETDAHPGFHPEGPQGSIDEKLRIEDCDVLVGIFWRRFGTPTNDAGSGTEHEFRVAYKAWTKSRTPEIMLYFKQRPYNPQSEEEIDQWRHVISFRTNLPKEALWWSYTSTRAFRDRFRKDLEDFVRRKTPLRGSLSQPATGDDSPTGGESSHTLTEFQNSYPVPNGIIDDNYISAIADVVFDLSEAAKVIAYVDTELKRLDPEATPLHPGTLVFRASAVEFWQSVFQEARLSGHRTAAAVIHFLLAQKLPDTVREHSSALLAALRKDYEGRKGGPA